MRTLVASTTVALSLLAGCTLYFGDDTGDDIVDPPCQSGENGLIAQSVRLVNPETLACQTFNGNPCDGTCGPCAELALPPELPPWGECASECIGLSEATCMTASACRITRRADYYYGNAGGTPTGDDYLGCYPLSDLAPPPGAVCKSLDALQCSANPACTGIYDAPDGVPCGNFKLPEQCPGAQFQGCVAETTTDPGECYQDLAVTCDAAPPVCPSGSTPGVLNACYSGVCIPREYCPLVAN